MVVTNNSGKLVGYLANLVSDKEVITVNATEYFTTVVTRDRESGRIQTQTFYGKNPFVSR
jgi:hypothetical protein